MSYSPKIIRMGAISYFAPCDKIALAQHALEPSMGVGSLGGAYRRTLGDFILWTSGMHLLLDQKWVLVIIGVPCRCA